MYRSLLRSLSAMSIFFALVFPAFLRGQNQAPGVSVMSSPQEGRLQRAHSFEGDLRSLPQMPAEKLKGRSLKSRARIRWLTREPHPRPSEVWRWPLTSCQVPASPLPLPGKSFEGLDFATWGAGHAADASGDVGAQYYIQTINAAVGVYDKSDGSRVAGFTLNALMSQGDFGNLCDSANLGEPVVVYDTFEQRWIITDFAFALSGDQAAAPCVPAFRGVQVRRSGRRRLELLFHSGQRWSGRRAQDRHLARWLVHVGQYFQRGRGQRISERVLVGLQQGRDVCGEPHGPGVLV